jgi:hypothetical protein
LCSLLGIAGHPAWENVSTCSRLFLNVLLKTVRIEQDAEIAGEKRNTGINTQDNLHKQLSSSVLRQRK